MADSQARIGRVIVVRRFLAVAPFFGLFLVVFGARLWVIGHYGNALPFWDQWHAEGLTVLKPWIEGHLTIGAIFAPHNEHRIVLTKLLALGLFIINGQWDALFEMTVNATLCAFIAVLMATAILKLFPASFHWPGFLAVGILFALPFAWENTLCGFQSQFYFLLLFSLIALWGLGLFTWRSPAWWLGVAGLILACLSMASGFFAAIPVAALHILRCLKARKRPSASSTATLLLCLAVIVAGLTTRTTVPGHLNLQAESVSAWILASGRCLAWPWITTPALAFLMQLPLLLLALGYLLSSSAAPENERNRGSMELLLVLGIWCIGQAVAMAYVRGGQNLPPSSRYMDLLAIGALVNFAAAFMCITQMRTVGRKIVSALILSAWLGFLSWGLVSLTLQNFKQEMPNRRSMLALEERNVRGYVRSGDERYLKGKSQMALPYPDVPTLRYLLDDESIRRILPSGVRPRLHFRNATETPSSGFLARGFPPTVSIPTYEKVWGSYDPSLEGATEGTWTTKLEAAPKLAYLRIDVSGYLGELSLNLALRDEGSGKQAAIHPGRVARERWQANFIEVPGKKSRELSMIATDQSPTRWFAFMEPVEVGRLSYWTLCLLGWSSTIFIAGLVLFLLTILSPWVVLALAHERGKARADITE